MVRDLARMTDLVRVDGRELIHHFAGQVGVWRGSVTHPPGSYIIIPEWGPGGPGSAQQENSDYITGLQTQYKGWSPL